MRLAAAVADFAARHRHGEARMDERREAAIDPHADQPVLAAGAALSDARAAMILIHGRGASAENILGLAREFEAPDVAFLAPQAAGYSWYPYSFLVPLEENEPYLSSALRCVGAVVDRVMAEGIPAERVMLLGFSQGACLSVEFAARHPRRLGGIAGLSGGLIGAEGTPRDYAGLLDGTPVFLGSSDPDPHIPVARVHETDAVLSRMGARVTTRIYPRMGHTICDDEIRFVREMVEAVRG
jgi:predicted esterase